MQAQNNLLCTIDNTLKSNLKETLRTPRGEMMFLDVDEIESQILTELGKSVLTKITNKL